MESKNSVFPLYLMIRDGSRVWLHIRDAGRLYDSGFIPVSIGGKVIRDESGSEHDITDEERQRIVNIADDYSGNK